MSQSELRAAGCEGKQGFPTFNEANISARATASRHKSYIAPYRCKLCHKYHIGQTFGRQSVQNQRRRVIRQTHDD